MGRKLALRSVQLRPHTTAAFGAALVATLFAALVVALIAALIAALVAAVVTALFAALDDAGLQRKTAWPCFSERTRL